MKRRADISLTYYNIFWWFLWRVKLSHFNFFFYNCSIMDFILNAGEFWNSNMASIIPCFYICQFRFTWRTTQMEFFDSISGLTQDLLNLWISQRNRETSLSSLRRFCWIFPMWYCLLPLINLCPISHSSPIFNSRFLGEKWSNFV
jgi:hypothetical protein